MQIQTPHLRLVPYSPKHLLALLEGPDQFARSFGWPPAEGVQGVVLSEEVDPEFLEGLRQTAEADLWIHGYAVVHWDSQEVIGNTRFMGPPDDEGAVEITYAIAPGFEGRGYATEATRAFVDFAFTNSHVRMVLAHTTPAANASTRVLEKCEFEFVGDVEDPDDGRVWRWRRSRRES